MGKAKKKPCLNEAAKLKTTSTATRSQTSASSKSAKACKKKTTSSKDTPSQRILEFFKKFHPWDFITAEAVRGKPSWVTCSRKFPLSPLSLYQKWENPDELVGVRFRNGSGGTTYFVIDIDKNSEYHPAENYGNFVSLLNSFEQIGLFGHIIIRSSFSGGLHLYFPLPEEVHCFKLALAIKETLVNNRFTLKSGQLEIFPHVKQKYSSYNAHRLPLQLGSCVLDENLEPIHNNLSKFIDAWEKASGLQDMQLIMPVIENAKPTWVKQINELKGNAQEWKQRLETTLEQGWTSSGQTNQIIQEACIYARVFEELEWDDVETWVIQKLPKLSGFREFCSHQADYQKRVQEWVEANRQHNRYYPYSQRSQSSQSSKEPKCPNNDAKYQDALRRIKGAIAQIEAEHGGLPRTVKERQILICKVAQCSATTLRKHLHLWHPAHQSQVKASGQQSSEQPSVKSIQGNGELNLEGCVTQEIVAFSGDSWANQVTTQMTESSKNQGVTHGGLLRCPRAVEGDSAELGVVRED
ncbi:MAG: hypothetical protein VKI82_03340 [Leptolyngbya sp.]|nr:hypothetical protein [Leptolyngbya sp.]